MKKARVLIVSLLLAAVVLCGCDPRGLLTEDETQELYEELCGDFSDASVWDMDIEIWNDMLKNKDGMSVVKSAANAFIEGSDEGPTRGNWFSSKKYCRSCTVNCSMSAECSGEVYSIESVTISKYGGRTKYKYHMVIDLAGFEKDDNNKSITVWFY